MDHDNVAVPQEVVKTDSLNVLCCICNEFYKADDNIYSTDRCGHVFHKACLIRWLSRSQTCPQCRTSCHRLRVHRIYLNFSERLEPEEEKRTQIIWMPLDLEEPPTAAELGKAVQCGVDHEGFNTYVARAYLEQDLLPANYVHEKNAVYTPWNCSSHHLKEEVDILMLTDCEVTWVLAENGHVPPNALKTGYTESGEPLYTGRAILTGQTTLGKVHSSHRVLYMPDGHKEVNSTTYEVLVVTPREPTD